MVPYPPTKLSSVREDKNGAPEDGLDTGWMRDVKKHFNGGHTHPARM